MNFRHFSFLFFTIAFTLTCISCKKDGKKAGEASSNTKEEMDVHSFATPDARIRHLDLDLNVDFTTRTLSGTATYDIEVKNGATAIVMDTRDLTIQSVKVDGQPVEFSFGEEKPFMGKPLSIPVTEKSEKVAITYQTTPGAEALQWLEPAQTAGKQDPYLFTQGQAILTRTWIPIQDSPGIRLTYSADISVPSHLLAVMSATNPQNKNAEGRYHFEMTQPIPAYLIALAVGDLAFKAIGPRTGVYTEPSMLARSANEFVDMEKMVETAEALYGPYQWDRYDVIVLPPSFPFGGMENPRLTFATPTIIAGDRSLVALIAHELAHSWSGNLVTNATWNDFWLNEGFTVYFELRIMEALYGKTYSDMLRNLGYQSLKATVQDVDEKDSHLYLDLHDRNPDDGMTDIAYEKGAHFLILLEQQVGREKFDAFLRKYFDTHKFQSMTTSQFIAYLKSELLEPNQIQIDINEWIYGPGLPANIPLVNASRFENVDAQQKTFVAGGTAAGMNTTEWTTHEWLHFILSLPDTLTTAQMKDLDQTFDLTASQNSEIQAAWYGLAIRQGYGKEILPSIESFLVEVGRRKFLTPLYTALVEHGMKKEAQAIFEKAKNNYHSVSYNTISKVVE